MEDYIGREDYIRIGRYIYKVVFRIGKWRILRLM